MPGSRAEDFLIPKDTQEQLPSTAGKIVKSPAGAQAKPSQKGASPELEGETSSSLARLFSNSPQRVTIGSARRRAPLQRSDRVLALDGKAKIGSKHSFKRILQEKVRELSRKPAKRDQLYVIRASSCPSLESILFFSLYINLF